MTLDPKDPRPDLVPPAQMGPVAVGIWWSLQLQYDGLMRRIELDHAEQRAAEGLLDGIRALERGVLST